MKLFAALDAHSKIRLVSEVPRGAACDCFCPACGSPLVARQGEFRDWHFAHEAGQERPDCAVGAANLLRRLALDHLRQMSSLAALPPLPWCRTAFPRPAQPAGGFSILRPSAKKIPLAIDWSIGSTGPNEPQQQPVATRWIESDANRHSSLGRSSPAGELTVFDGQKIDVFLQASGLDAALELEDSVAPTLLFAVPPMSATDWSTRELISAHMKRSGSFIWLRQPAPPEWVTEQVATAVLSLEHEQRVQNAAVEQQAKERADAAGRRWAAMARQRADAVAYQEPLPPPDTSGRSTEPPSHEDLPAASASRPMHSADPVMADGAGHLPGAKLNASAVLYLDDIESWSFYELVDGSMAIAPWPLPWEGWEESLPSSVGRADLGLGAYRVSSPATAATFLGRTSKSVRSLP